MLTNSLIENESYEDRVRDIKHFIEIEVPKRIGQLKSILYRPFFRARTCSEIRFVLEFSRADGSEYVPPVKRARIEVFSKIMAVPAGFILRNYPLIENLDLLRHIMKTFVADLDILLLWTGKIIQIKWSLFASNAIVLLTEVRNKCGYFIFRKYADFFDSNHQLGDNIPETVHKNLYREDGQFEIETQFEMRRIVCEIRDRYIRLHLELRQRFKELGMTLLNF